MGSKYRNLDAIGQINDMACWAASLTWWYQAAMSIFPSQQKLWDHYQHLREPLGGMPDSGVKQIIRENAMMLIEYPKSSDMGIDELKWMLSYGPVYLAYMESGTGKRHVNVIYEAKGNAEYAEVRAMEPQAHSKGNGGWKGAHKKKPINDFNLIGSIWAGVSKKKYNAG